MKEKVMIFIIGLLLGSVISTGSIFIYTVANNINTNNNNQTMQMPGGNPPSMPDRQNNGNMEDNGNGTQQRQREQKQDQIDKQNSNQENNN